MVLAGTRAGLFRVGDTGGRWSAECLLATDKPIMSLAVDASGETVCVGFYQGGMCASADGGRSWRPIGADLPYQDVRTLALHPRDPQTIYAGTEPAALYVSHDGGQRFEELTAVRTHPAARDWAFPIRPKLGHVRTLAFHPGNAQTFYVGIEVGSLLKTTDGGQTFSEASAMPPSTMPPRRPAAREAATSTMPSRKSRCCRTFPMRPRATPGAARCTRRVSIARSGK